MKTAQVDPRVERNIAGAPAFAQPILRELRAWVREACPEAQETIKWGHIAFVTEHGILCMLGTFKAHCTFGFWHRGMVAVVGKDGRDADSAMGIFGRITRLEDLPNKQAMLGYIRAAAALGASGEPALVRPRAKTKPEAKVPAEPTAALKKNRAAATTFAGLSPSGRRDYVEWIAEAKRDETRVKRLATSVEWLAEGKARNWKYEKC
jgi:uncharacterized protein YdeI (YjbR/CyaY-like superfamily)